MPNAAQANQDVMVVQSGLIAPSSVRSTTQHKYPVDDVQVDTPCMLVVPYGRKLNKFREVANSHGGNMSRVSKATCSRIRLGTSR